MTTAILQTDSTASAAADTAAHKTATGARHTAKPQAAERPDTTARADSTTATRAAMADTTVQVTALSDTLYTFGEGYGPRNAAAEASSPTVEPYAINDTLLSTLAADWRQGVGGDPVPYTIRGDNTITALLLGCFIIALAVFGKSRRFMLMQAKHFFREPHHNTIEMSETTVEVHHHVFFVLQTCLLLSIITFLYTLERVADTFKLESQYQLVAIFFGIFTGYFAVKLLLYWIVNGVFFGKKKSVRWLKSFLFATSAEGMALFPLVLLLSYFDLSIQKATIYAVSVIVVVKTALLYKSFVMFFKNKSFFLQNILYFCALEMVPLLSLGSFLVKVVDYLKINF